MCRLFASLVLLFLVAHAPAAPIPPERRQATLYHATTKGTKWIYNYRGLDEEGAKFERDEVLVVTAVEEHGENKTVTVCSEEEDKLRPRWTIVVYPKGLYKLANDDGKLLCVPQCILKVPAKVGDTWQRRWNRKATIGAIEKVEVPAGTYTAVRVDWALHTDGGGPPSATFWYAPDIGVVKVEYGEAVGVLKSFLPAKE
jgi:hypothetical protein